MSAGDVKIFTLGLIFMCMFTVGEKANARIVAIVCSTEEHQ